MAVPTDLEGLRFPCECVSARRTGDTDPWSDIAKNRLLPDGVKEGILNLLAREPKTISQLAEQLHLSPPSVFTHITDMVRSELLRESDDWEKKYPSERYYEPNFPIVKPDESAEFRDLSLKMAQQVADIFGERLQEMEHAFHRTGLAKRGWSFSDISQYIYSKVQRGARELLEQNGTLPSRQRHANGAEWIFWAEEPEVDEDK